ncbi:bile acid:sodium symporter family protein [Elongatibacter sediminis]|uniref:Bile acid:sodium symporter n=1 Tax=Elongatibacter sediminis TaxID=3119006 RepID=A0AAW9R9H5_9GAMM
MTLIDDILLPASLWTIMFSMGLSLTVDDFRRIAANRRALYVGIGSMLVVPPLIGLVFVSFFAPTPELAVGFILLATCPGGMLSNLMTDLAEGDLALSLSLSILVSMVYIVVVPFYAHFAIQHFIGVEAQVSVPLIDFVWKVFSITLIPASLGLLLRTYRNDLALRIKGAVKILGTGVLVVAFGFILVDQIPVLREHFSSLFGVTLGMNLANLAVALTLTTVFALVPKERVAIGIEHMIRQEGTAIYIAVTIVGSREMSLPMIMNTPVALFLCIAFVFLSRRSLAESRAGAAKV